MINYNFRRLKDINAVHEFIKQELQNITIKMETMNNLDSIVRAVLRGDISNRYIDQFIFHLIFFNLLYSFY